MIQVTDDIFLDENDIELKFVRSSGPGGQHVNKVSTAVQLRFNLLNAGTFSDELRLQLIERLRSKLTAAGDILIVSQEHRSQEKNRAAAIQRLVEMIRIAATPVKKRRKTKPGRAARRRRLEAKRRRGDIKRTRRRVDPSGDN